MPAARSGPAAPRRRGPQPRHTRQEVAQAAVAIADAEGLDAVTFRAVAAHRPAGRSAPGIGRPAQRLRRQFRQHQADQPRRCRARPGPDRGRERPAGRTARLRPVSEVRRRDRRRRPAGHGPLGAIRAPARPDHGRPHPVRQPGTRRRFLMSPRPAGAPRSQLPAGNRRRPHRPAPRSRSRRDRYRYVGGGGYLASRSRPDWARKHQAERLPGRCG